MDLKTIQKNYDKLTIDERFSLIVAAGQRGDDRDRAALIQTAPKKTWQMPNTYGLSEAFEFASFWHVTTQLGYAASLYYFAVIGDESCSKKTADEIDKAVKLLQRRVLTGCHAWRIVCKDYGVDPDLFINDMPFIEMIELTELTADKAMQADDEPYIELQETIDGIKKAIEWQRKKWE